MDDNSHSIANAVALNGITSIAPGEAVVFIETADLATTAAAFASLWFGASPPPVPQIGSYSGSGVGLSGNGDEVALFDGAGNLVTGVGFGAARGGPVRDLRQPHRRRRPTLPLPVISTLSATGVDGAFAAAGERQRDRLAGHRQRRPADRHRGRAVGQRHSPYAADWFEVTNVGSAAVDMTGWKMDDSSNSIAAAVPILGVGSVAPGQSAVLIEGDRHDRGHLRDGVVRRHASRGLSDRHLQRLGRGAEHQRRRGEPVQPVRQSTSPACSSAPPPTASRSTTRRAWPR